MQQLDYNNTTTTYHERNNYLVLTILSVNHGAYNMNIICNQKSMFCKAVV